MTCLRSFWAPTMIRCNASKSQPGDARPIDWAAEHCRRPSRRPWRTALAHIEEAGRRPSSRAQELELARIRLFDARQVAESLLERDPRSLDPAALRCPLIAQQIAAVYSFLGEPQNTGTRLANAYRASRKQLDNQVGWLYDIFVQKMKGAKGLSSGQEGQDISHDGPLFQRTRETGRTAVGLSNGRLSTIRTRFDTSPKRQRRTIPVPAPCFGLVSLEPPGCRSYLAPPGALFPKTGSKAPVEPRCNPGIPARCSATRGPELSPTW